MTTSNEPNEGTETQSHRIQAYEALWVTTVLEPDPQQEQGIAVVDEWFHHGVEHTESTWEYECSCGRTFDSYEDAATHLEETITDVSDQEN